MTKLPIITSNTLPFNERLGKSLLIALIMGLCVYASMIGSITVSVISRKSIESDTRNLISEINRLELTYLSVSQSMDIEYAHSHNFVNTPISSFASIDQPVALNAKQR